ncbi:MAG: hypothetical protein M3437_18095 [Chloroflexota bacterium]|nr:hypothetical protein [Chloroflexota bacterium]MDQ5865356.1 hypothetical protein [Chloroflexota bacterium]
MHNPRHVWLAGILLLLGAAVPVLANVAGQEHAAAVAGLATAAPTTTVLATDTLVEVAKKIDCPTPTAVPTLDREDCAVTESPETPFAAPAPYHPHAPWAGKFWYGTNRLWTVLPHDGVWSGLPHNLDGYGQKILWWREGYSWTEDPTPQLTVTGRRLDAPAPPLQAHEATNAYAEDIGSAMLVGVSFPTPGCWEITGKTPDPELSFVVWVQP